MHRISSLLQVVFSFFWLRYCWCWWHDIVGVGAMILSQGGQLVAESRPVNINPPHLAYTVQTFLYLQEVPIKTFRNKVARSRQDSIACFSSFVRSLDFMIFLDLLAGGTL